VLVRARSPVEKIIFGEYKTMTAVAAVTYADLALGLQASTGKGAKACPITGIGGAAVLWAPPGTRAVAFEPKPYGEVTLAEVNRVNLVMRTGDVAMVRAVKDLDAWAVVAAAEASERLFGRELTAAEVFERYSPMLKLSDKWEPTFKAKINLAGRGAVKIWTPDGQRRDAPATWVGLEVRPQLTIKGMWFVGAGFGLTVECADLQLTDRSEAQCPF
jgi:hypothetical protein